MTIQMDPRRAALPLAAAAPRDESERAGTEGPRFDEVLRREERPREAPAKPDARARAERPAARAANAKTTTRARDDEPAQEPAKTTEAPREEPAKSAGDAPPTEAVDPRLAWMLQVPMNPQAPPPTMQELGFSALLPRAEEAPVQGELFPAMSAPTSAPVVERAPAELSAETAPTLRPDAPVAADVVSARGPTPEPAAPTPEPTQAQAPAAQEAVSTAQTPQRPTTPTTETTAPRPEVAAQAVTPERREGAAKDQGGASERRSDDAPKSQLPLFGDAAMTAQPVSAERVTTDTPVTTARDVAVTDVGARNALRERLERAALGSSNRVANEVRSQGEVVDEALGRVVVTATQRAGTVDLHLHADREPTLRALRGYRDDIVAEVQTADVLVGAVRFEGGGTDVGLSDGAPRDNASAWADARSDGRSDGDGGGEPRGQHGPRAAEAPKVQGRPARVRAVL
jgi:hypothetical protein